MYCTVLELLQLNFDDFPLDMIDVYAAVKWGWAAEL
jgi:hypothetical protein